MFCSLSFSNFNPICTISPNMSLAEYRDLFKPDIKSLIFVADALRLQTHGQIAPGSCQTSCKGGCRDAANALSERKSANVSPGTAWNDEVKGDTLARKYISSFYISSFRHRTPWTQGTR